MSLITNPVSEKRHSIRSDSELLMDFDCSTDKVNDLVESRIGAEPVVAKLVHPKDIAAPQAYKRFSDVTKKETYRSQLLMMLGNSWAQQVGSDRAQEMVDQFIELAAHLDENGAVIFGAILSSENFQKLIDKYTEILEGSGSKSWIHAYVNLANHPDFLTDKEFNGAFLHPYCSCFLSNRRSRSDRRC